MSILKEIVANKKEEVSFRKLTTSVVGFENMPNFKRPCLSFKEHLLDPTKHGIIAEFKRKSPSKGEIHPNASASKITREYELAGASAISVLTEQRYFNGYDTDLIEARQNVGIPIIRKDFVVDILQIAEAKVLGADAILLIAETLEKQELKDYYDYAYSIGLEAIVEVHGEDDLTKLPSYVEMVGVNSRNLNTFSVNLDHSANMLSKLPENAVRIAESGIASASDYLRMRSIGFNAFLIGEYFMRNEEPAQACIKLIEEVNASLKR